MIRQITLIVALAFAASPLCSGATPRLAELKAAAEAGNAQAQDSLAEAYRRISDHANATFWYRKAAEQGIANSQYQLAQTLIYEATTSWVKVDSKPAQAAEGLELLQRAARQGHTRAQLHLGRLNQEGKVVSQDYVEAYKWFAIAGRSGVLDSPAMEGRMYRDRLILKMSQAEIAEGESRASRFTPGHTPSKGTVPSYISQLRLQGISGPSKRRLALINGRTFEAGEGGSVKLGETWVSLTCLKVTTNSAHVALPETGTRVQLPLGKAPLVEDPPVQDRQPGTSQSPPAVQPRQQPVRKPPAAKPPTPVPTIQPKAPDPFAPTKKTLRVLAWIPVTGGILVSLAILGFVVVVPLLRRGTKRLAPRTANPADLQPPVLGSVETVPQASGHIQDADLMQRLRKLDWFQFEKVVAIVFRKKGYKVEHLGGANPDGGIDLFAEKDGGRLAVQCKHWHKAEVGVKTMREFLGAMKDSAADKGIFVALAGFTDPARDLAAKHGIEIIEGEHLATMLVEAHAKWDPELIALLNDQTKHCPKCGAEMVVRTAQQGSHIGGTFWGCSRYPRCHFTLPTTPSSAPDQA